MLSWINIVSNLTSPPLVHSVSYGTDERQNITGDTAYMRSVNVQFMKAGARGLSILISSGDQGVCGRLGCDNATHFYPQFPASSPYVTTVGGTDFLQQGVIGDEKVWGSGGGGFSDTFALPLFQASAVAAYKANPDADLPPQSMWNATGRAYPDVSALAGYGDPYCTVTGGFVMGASGTSCSSPVVAAIFARLNGVRLAAGQAPLGWLNPFIYQNGDAFNDVVVGMNNGTAPFDKPNPYGFKATKGWDPASGWGTPNMADLLKRVASLGVVV